MEKLIKTNMHFCKSGYEFVTGDEAHLRFKKNWDGRKRSGAMLKVMKGISKHDCLLPKSPVQNQSDYTIKPMPEKFWVEFFNLAQETKVCHDEYDLIDVKEKIVRFANKHGDLDLYELSDWIEGLRFMNDIYHVRKEGDLDEVNSLIHDKKRSFSPGDLQMVMETDKSKRIKSFIETVDVLQGMVMDFMFGNGLLQKWLRCDQCGTGFQAKRRRKYCSAKCKRRAQYERDTYLGGKQ